MTKFVQHPGKLRPERTSDSCTIYLMAVYFFAAGIAGKTSLMILLFCALRPGFDTSWLFKSIKSPHSRSHRPCTLTTFSSCDRELWPITLTFKFDLDSVKINQRVKCPGQWSFCSEVFCPKTQTNTRPNCSTWTTKVVGKYPWSGDQSSIIIIIFSIILSGGAYNVPSALLAGGGEGNIPSQVLTPLCYLSFALRSFGSRHFRGRQQCCGRIGAYGSTSSSNSCTFHSVYGIQGIRILRAQSRRC